MTFGHTTWTDDGNENVPLTNRRIFPFEMKEDYVIVVTEGLEPTVMRLWTNGCLTELTLKEAKRMYAILGDAISQVEGQVQVLGETSADKVRISDKTSSHLSDHRNITTDEMENPTKTSYLCPI